MKTSIYNGIGINDEAFIRGGAPMTKAEVRAVTISKLKPQPEDTVLDIGAGTGSVGVECAFLAKKIIAVECDENAVLLIEQNKERFGRKNIEVIAGKAPEALEHIDCVDCVFIGGSKGALKEVFTRASEILTDGGRIAANFVTLENTVLFLKLLKEGGYQDIDIAQIQVSKGRIIGETTMMQAHNPVFIISGVRKR